MNSTTQKMLKTEMLKTEAGSRKAVVEAPWWWRALPWGERRLLIGVARMLRAARESEDPGVARAAAKWGRTLGCFIKVRLMHEARRCRIACGGDAGTRCAAHTLKAASERPLHGEKRRGPRL